MHCIAYLAPLLHITLSSVVCTGNIRLVIALVSAGADVAVRSAKGWTPIHVAAGFSRVSIISYLVHLGADVNVVDDDSDTPLITATAMGFTDAVQMLLTSGADPNYVTDVCTGIEANHSH